MSLRTPLSPSGRASPFRRAESPSSSSSSSSQQPSSQPASASSSSSSSSQQRPTTPTGSSSNASNAYQSTRPATPSRLHNSTVSNGDGTWTTSSPSAAGLRGSVMGMGRDAPLSPSRASPAQTPVGPGMLRSVNGVGNGVGNGISNGAGPAGARNNAGMGTSFGSAGRRTGTTAAPSSSSLAPSSSATTTTARPTPSSAPLNTDALSKLPAAQVRELREAFSILDRDGDGQVDAGDVEDMLGQVGLDASTSTVSSFFPGGALSSSSSSIPMAAFLSGIATSLARMGPPHELLAALSAFDDDDSGQIDVDELVDAVMAGGGGAGAGAGMSRHDVQAVLAGFTGRRAFNKYSATAQGLGGPGAACSGDVFRYREWVAGLGPVAAAGNAERTQAA